MLELYNDSNNKVFDFKLDIEGTKKEDLDVRMIVTFEKHNRNYLFFGKLHKDNVFRVEIPALTEIEQNTFGELKLEVIAEDMIFNTWDSQFQIKSKTRARAHVKVNEMNAFEQKQDKTAKITVDTVEVNEEDKENEEVENEVENEVDVNEKEATNLNTNLNSSPAENTTQDTQQQTKEDSTQDTAQETKTDSTQHTENSNQEDEIKAKNAEEKRKAETQSNESTDEKHRIKRLIQEIQEVPEINEQIERRPAPKRMPVKVKLQENIKEKVVKKAKAKTKAKPLQKSKIDKIFENITKPGAARKKSTNKPNKNEVVKFSDFF